MLTMYTRRLALPRHSFFLFGPRGTGKSTWLRQQLPDALWFDLLRLPTVLQLTRQPELFRSQVEALPKGAWVVVDEVQRLPALLNEVHALIAEYGGRYRFALSGSSARKLRRLDTNLLAGRAITRRFFPLTGAELDFDLDVNELLSTGCLPRVRSEPDAAVDILDAYVGTYLREEIQQEALTKDVGAFARFLEVAAVSNGQVVNVAGVARDAGVARPTVARYFDVLVDTLIGSWLPAWRPRARIKGVQHPGEGVPDMAPRVWDSAGRFAAERYALGGVRHLHGHRAAQGSRGTGAPGKGVHAGTRWGNRSGVGVQ